MTDPIPNPPNPTPDPAPAPNPAPASAAAAPPPTGSPLPKPGLERRVPKQFRRDKPQPGAGRPAVLTPMELLPASPNLRDLDKDIEAELAAAMSGFSDDAIKETEEKKQRTPTKPGERKKGRIISIHGGDVFVDTGGRSQGVLSMQQFPEGTPKVGDEVEFAIEGFDGANGLLQLTRSGAAQVVTDWSSVSLGMNVEAKVTSTNKGGLSIEVNGIRGFMPFREIDIYRVENAEQFVNQKLICEVIELNPEERNLVVSRRKLLERERDRLREKFWAEIEEGQTRSGTVRGIQPFGVFVDLGGADGLVPISEMAWARVEKPEDLVKIGQTVQVKVMKVDFEKHKIALSLRQLTTSPWDTLQERLHVGSRVRGKVTRTAEFGAFVEVEPGIEGLIHISELGTARVRRVRDVVSEGQEVEVQIVNIDMAARRIGLSLKVIAAESERQANQAAMTEQEARDAAAAAEEDAEADKELEELRKRKRSYDLKGGMGGGSGLISGGNG